MSLTPDGFALGYDSAAATIAKAAMRAGRHATVKAPSGPLPPAISVRKYRLRKLNQKQAGTCWLHAAVQLTETLAGVLGLKAFPICRRLVGYVGQRMNGGNGRNPSDGGTGIDALAAMTADKGVGIAHEDLLPYTDNYRALGTKPPQNVYDDAKAVHLDTPIDVRSLDEVKALLAVNQPSIIGIWWPYGWDQPVTFHASIGRGTFGHELFFMGYADKGVFDDYEWFLLDNWHGENLYPSLSAALAAKVPGYLDDGEEVPEMDSCFWVRRDVLEAVIGYGNADFASATNLTGLVADALEINLGDGLV